MGPDAAKYGELNKDNKSWTLFRLRQSKLDYFAKAGTQSRKLREDYFYWHKLSEVGDLMLFEFSSIRTVK